MRRSIFLFLGILVMARMSAESPKWKMLLDDLRMKEQQLVMSLNSIEAELTLTRQALNEQKSDNEQMQGELSGLKKTLTDRIGELETSKKQLREQRAQLAAQEKRLLESERLLPSLRRSLNDLKGQMEIEKAVLKITLGIASAGLAGAGISYFATNEPILGVMGLVLGVGGGIVLLCVN